MTIRVSRWAVPLAAGLGLLTATSFAAMAEDIKIAHVYGKTGPFEAYAKQSHTGLMMGLEYATDGTMEIDGRSTGRCGALCILCPGPGCCWS